VTPLKLSKRLSVSFTNAAVDKIPAVHVTCNYIGTMRVTFVTREFHKRK
jgi:hypothetical protein